MNYLSEKIESLSINAKIDNRTQASQTANKNVSGKRKVRLPPHIRAIDDAARQCMINAPDFNGARTYICPTSGKLTMQFMGGHTMGPDYPEQRDYHREVKLKILQRARRLKFEYIKLNPLSLAGQISTGMQYIPASTDDTPDDAADNAADNTTDSTADDAEDNAVPTKKGFDKLAVELMLDIFELVVAPPPCKHFHDSIERIRKRNSDQSMAVAIQRSPAFEVMEDRSLWSLSVVSRSVMDKAYGKWHTNMLAIDQMPIDQAALDALNLVCMGDTKTTYWHYLFMDQMAELGDDGRKWGREEPTEMDDLWRDCNRADVSVGRALRRPWTTSVMDDRLYKWPATERDVPDNKEERHWLSLANFNIEYSWTVRKLADTSNDEAINRIVCPMGVVKLREMRKTAQRLVDWSEEGVSK